MLFLSPKILNDIVVITNFANAPAKATEEQL